MHHTEALIMSERGAITLRRFAGWLDFEEVGERLRGRGHILDVQHYGSH